MAKASRDSYIMSALETAYGSRGISRMAANADISRQLLSSIIIGKRRVTDNVYRRLAEALEAGRERTAAKKIDHIAGRMLAEQEG